MCILWKTPSKLEVVWLAPDRLTGDVPWFGHISAFMRDFLHWLPVQQPEATPDISYNYRHSRYPVRTAQDKSAPTKRPRQMGPDKTAPTKRPSSKWPRQNSPVISAPVITAPVKSTPVISAPVKSAPVKPAPVNIGPSHIGPSQNIPCPKYF